ncbi:MAG TPA: HepT-like ribonuclease domain-containing protein [Thermoanaerobaculia bacterium]|nr:HepT-like ribonuclease domain-containing protein [Thermoanaerobaculia bacterium]
MLPEDDRIRLQHMLDAARKAARLAAGRDREDLDAEDDPLADALVRLISVIGEAASKVSSGTCSDLDGIPWPDVVGMRNRLIHAYFDINLDILWATVQDSLPPLVRLLESALADDEEHPTTTPW